MRKRDAAARRIAESLAGVAAVPLESLFRVLPGVPEQSILLLSLSGEGGADVQPMPPIVVQLRDGAAVERVREWIRLLPRLSASP